MAILRGILVKIFDSMGSGIYTAFLASKTAAKCRPKICFLFEKL